MQIFQVTLLDGVPTPLWPGTVQPSPMASPYFQQLLIQNNSAAVIRIGDSTVSATRGISIASGGGLFDFGSFVDYATELNEWFVFGTSGDVVDIMFQQ